MEKINSYKTFEEKTKEKPDTYIEKLSDKELDKGIVRKEQFKAHGVWWTASVLKNNYVVLEYSGRKYIKGDHLEQMKELPEVKEYLKGLLKRTNKLTEQTKQLEAEIIEPDTQSIAQVFRYSPWSGSSFMIYINNEEEKVTLAEVSLEIIYPFSFFTHNDFQGIDKARVKALEFVKEKISPVGKSHNRRNLLILSA
jgi:hypothetical protein